MATVKVRRNHCGREEHIIICLQVNLLFFAKSRELTKLTHTIIELPVQITGKELWASIVNIFPRYNE